MPGPGICGTSKNLVLSKRNFKQVRQDKRNKAERELWKRTMENGEQNENDFSLALNLITKHNSLDDSFDRARHYGSVAKDALGLFKDGPEKHALQDVVNFCINRSH